MKHIEHINIFESKNKLEYTNTEVNFNEKVYFISTDDDKKPWERDWTVDIDEAVRRFERIQDITTSNYVIYEADIKTLTKKDIDILKTSKSFNL